MFIWLNSLFFAEIIYFLSFRDNHDERGKFYYYMKSFDYV